MTDEKEQSATSSSLTRDDDPDSEALQWSSLPWSNLPQWARVRDTESIMNEREGDSVATLPGSIRSDKNPDKQSAPDECAIGIPEDWLKWNPDYKESVAEPTGVQDIEFGLDYQQDYKQGTENNLDWTSGSRLSIEQTEDQDVEHEWDHKNCKPKEPSTSSVKDQDVQHGREHEEPSASQNSAASPPSKDQQGRENENNELKETSPPQDLAASQASCSSDLQSNQEDMELLAEVAIAAADIYAERHQPSTIDVPSKQEVASPSLQNVVTAADESDAEGHESDAVGAVLSTDGQDVENGDYGDAFDATSSQQAVSPSLQNVVIAADKADAEGHQPDVTSTSSENAPLSDIHTEEGAAASTISPITEDQDSEYGAYKVYENTVAAQSPGAYVLRQLRAGEDEEQGKMTSYERSTMFPSDVAFADPADYAHATDPDQEEQIVHKHLGHKAERQLGKTAVAEVVAGRFSTKTKRRLLIGVVLLIAVVLGVGLGVARNKSDPPPELPFEAEPPSEEELIELISSASSDGGAALRTNSTPQYEAFKWLTNNNSRLGDYSDERILQRYALATFYYSTKGGNWTRSDGWLDDGDECNRWWQSVGQLACSDSGEVVRLELDTNNLHGSVPDEIGFLSSLAKLTLHSNQLTGGIPTDIGRLTLLEHFSVGSNLLDGTFPDEITQLTRLSTLNVHSNQLASTIPTGIGLLTALEELTIRNNELHGTIPAELGDLTKLTTLNIRRNKLVGSIPPVIYDLTTLEDLNLGRNSLVGKIPIAIRRLSNLVGFAIDHGAHLTGTIPSFIGELTRLERLELQENMFTGRIPSVVNEMTTLDTLAVYDNELTGNFSCPEFITDCFISCNDDSNESCRSL